MSIEVVGVSKKFNDFVALDNVSVHVPQGSLTALLGPSGSGKSTLLRVIAGLEVPDAGVVSIAGEDLSRVPARRRGIGFVFQHYAAFKHMSVWENVAFGLRVQKIPKAEIRSRVGELLHLVQLDGFGERFPSQLSGGQRQRMALARALAVRPSVLLLDEPFGALDARVREELRAWLHDLHEHMPVTTVLVTHDQEEAMEVADRIVVMNAGKIEQVGSPFELYDHPASPFVMRFIGKVNEVDQVFVRPHDVTVDVVEAPGSSRALVKRVTYLGFEVRLVMEMESGQPLVAQLSRDVATRLAPEVGHTVWVTIGHGRAFSEAEGRLAERPREMRDVAGSVA